MSRQSNDHGLVHGPDCRECTVKAMDQCTGTPHETASRLTHTLRAYAALEIACEEVKRDNRRLRAALTQAPETQYANPTLETTWADE